MKFNKYTDKELPLNGLSGLTVRGGITVINTEQFCKPTINPNNRIGIGFVLKEILSVTKKYTLYIEVY